MGNNVVARKLQENWEGTWHTKLIKVTFFCFMKLQLSRQDFRPTTRQKKLFNMELYQLRRGSLTVVEGTAVETTVSFGRTVIWFYCTLSADSTASFMKPHTQTQIYTDYLFKLRCDEMMEKQRNKKSTNFPKKENETFNVQNTLVQWRSRRIWSERNV